MTSRAERYKEIIAQAPKILFTIEAFRPQVEVEGGKKGFTVFKFSPTDVFDGNGECVGSIGGGTGYVTILYHGEEWLISHKELWLAFERAWKGTTE
jgi:hypothetical protein